MNNHTTSTSNNSDGQRKPLLTRWRLRARALFSNDTEQAWHDLLEETQEAGETLTEHERSLVSAALQLDTVEAEEVSLARSEIVFLDINDPFKQVLQIFKTSRKSRLPVVEKDLDHVKGFISLKDIITFVGKEESFRLANIVRPATFIPETMSVDRVLQHMKKSRTQIAIVVDEYGGTAGLVTLKDILEKLVGDIEDEDEDVRPAAPSALGSGHFRIDPRMEVESFYNFFNFSNETDDQDDFETVGGLVLALAGRIPQKGESFTDNSGLTYTVTATNGRQILELEVLKTEPAHGYAQETPS
jgi:CBS domain containing-hemolysin-like protein